MKLGGIREQIGERKRMPVLDLREDTGILPPGEREQGERRKDPSFRRR
jgi:hypothetical protein